MDDYKNKNLVQQQELYKLIEEKMKEFNRGSKISLQGYQTTFDNWAWLQLRAQLVDNALMSVLISIVFAFLILVFTSFNLYTSLIAIFCISAVIFFLLFAIYALGWDFGIIESTCVIVFIGVSIDYVVHICH